MLFSIIIPVYNTDIKIFERCINSIVVLKNNQYEIIVIDDGSFDNNSLLYKKYCERFNNIRYYKINNNGVSNARNVGINYANGKYVLFVDSDDTINSCVIDNEILNNNYDIIVYDYEILKDEKSIKIKEFNSCSNFILIKEVLKEFSLTSCFHSPCYKFYKRDLLLRNDIMFDTNLIHGEDAIFNYNVLSTNPSIYYNPVVLYTYFYSPSTEEKRWKNNTEKMFNNFIGLLNIKEKIVLDLNDKNLISEFNNLKVRVCFQTYMQLVNICNRDEYVVLLRDVLHTLKLKDFFLLNYENKLKFFLMMINASIFVKFLIFLRNLSR